MPGASLLVERLAQHDADDEALGPVVEVVEVDDGDLLRVEVDGVRSSASATSARIEVLDVAARRRARRRTNALTVPVPMARPAHAVGVVVVVEHASTR